MSRLNTYAPYFLAILRMITALLFITHGTSKLFGWPVAMQQEVFSLMGLAGILEVVGGVMHVIGLFTRPVAFILAGEMAAAYFMAHAPQDFFPLINQGESAVLFCFIFLYLIFSGPGPLSVDQSRARA